jgi:hypothetical protein
MRFIYGYEFMTGSAAVLKADLEDILAGRPAQMIAETAQTGMNEPPPVATDEDARAKGGRKPNPDVDRFWIEMCRLLVHEAVKGGQQGYNETMAQWAQDNMDKPYDADTVRKKVSSLFKVLGWD